MTNYNSAFTGAQIDAALTKADGAVQSDPTGVTGADTVTNIITLTQAEYDAIVTPNSTTIYMITAT